MSIEIWLAFVVASAALLVIPGPTILTVISYSLSHGYSVKIRLVAAVALGDATALALSILGLGTVLAQSAVWFQTVKWIGGIYLLYLGFGLIKNGLNASELSLEKSQDSGRRLFFNTYLVTALNPKGIIFFVAFLPHFVSIKANVGYQLWVLAITFVVLAALNTVLYAFFAGKARQFLSSARAQKLFDFTGGSILTSAGVWALTASQSK